MMVNPAGASHLGSQQGFGAVISHLGAALACCDVAASPLEAPLRSRSVRSALDTLMANRTTIVVAHRLCTIQAADVRGFARQHAQTDFT
jgi:hypothetical protein